MLKKFVLITVAFSFLCFSEQAYAGQKLRRLNLEECLEVAGEKNRTIKEAEEKIYQEKKKFLEATGNFLPSVSAAGTFTRLDENISTQRTLTSPGSELYTGRNTYAITGRIQVPLFTGFRNTSLYRSAAVSVKIQQENYRKVLNDLYLDIKEAFYRVLLTQKTIELNRESEKRLEKHLNQTKTLYENGLASKLDLLRSELQLTNLRSETMQMENNLRAAKDSLRLLTGLNGDEVSLEPEGELSYSEADINLQDSIQKAFKKRPDLNMLQLQKKVAREGITTARSGGLPQVYASYNQRFEHPDEMYDKWGESWNFMINVELPVFRGFSTHSNISRARSRERQLEHNISRLEDGIRLEVENTYYEIINEEENIKTLEKNIMQAQEALSIAERQYRNGIITGLEFIDTELSYMQAHLNLLRAKADYLAALSRHRHATGGK